MIRIVIGAVIGAAITFAGAAYQNANYWSAKACDDVGRHDYFFNEEAATAAERRAVAYALAEMRQFACGQDTAFERRELLKAMGAPD
jgi:hypothetical protein